MIFHHVGMVVRDIEEARGHFVNVLGLHIQAPPVDDPAQEVIVQFLKGEMDLTSVELIQPASSESPVSAFLAKGGGLAHLCYEVEEIEEAIENARRGGALLISGPVPAVAFNHRKIAFVFLKSIGLIEFVEKEGR